MMSSHDTNVNSHSLWSTKYSNSWHTRDWSSWQQPLAFLISQTHGRHLWTMYEPSSVIVHRLQDQNGSRVSLHTHYCSCWSWFQDECSIVALNMVEEFIRLQAGNNVACNAINPITKNSRIQGCKTGTKVFRSFTNL